MGFEIIDTIYEDGNGTRVFDVKVGNETVKGFQATKISDSKCRKCNLNRGCNQNTICRKYDCTKNVRSLQLTFQRITTFLVAIWAFFVFWHFEFGFFYKLSLLLATLTCFDVVCTLIEEFVPKIYNRLFMKKVIKKLKVQRKEKKAEEEKLKAEEATRFRDIPGYKEVQNAKILVKSFVELCVQCDYGTNADKIKNCVENCEVIIRILEKDHSLYYGVSDLFELQLPRICTTMTLHKKAIDDNKVGQQQEKIFTRFVEFALEYINRKKNDIIYYNNGEELNLQLSVDDLRKSLQEENE